jgi:hypothetical protein
MFVVVRGVKEGARGFGFRFELSERILCTVFAIFQASTCFRMRWLGRRAIQNSGTNVLALFLDFFILHRLGCHDSKIEKFLRI